jgi:hypothetical protein
MALVERRVCLSTTLMPPSLFFPFYRPVAALPLLPAFRKDKDAQVDALGVLSLDTSNLASGLVDGNTLINKFSDEMRAW